MATLVIIESPKKVKTIGPILGDRYTVMAGVGHVHDPLSKEMDLEPPIFELFYEAIERGRSVLVKLKAAVKEADGMILAIGPDRKGEVILQYLAETLNLKNPQRIMFAAITKDKILAAFVKPRSLDMQCVYTQGARRALGRIISYRTSPALFDATDQKIGTGRVQSSAVCLAVDLEHTIAAFKSTQHCGAELTSTNEDVTSRKAQLDTKSHLAPGEIYLLDDKLAKLTAAIRDVTVAEYSDSEKSKALKASSTTLTLQQATGQRLRLKPKETMNIAQSLYDQGFVTYLRTDSPNIDDEGVANIATCAQNAGSPLADRQRKWKAKDGVQEDREAIRPTHAENPDCGVDAAEKALYQFIWQCAVASQLAGAIYAVRTVRLAGDAEGAPVSFKATDKTLVSPGQRTVYAEDTPDGGVEKDEINSNPIPTLAADDALATSDDRLLTKKAKPPVWFKLPTLVIEMEGLGIGRPSTYAATLNNIMARGYTTEDKKGYLLPPSTGEILRDSLVSQFEFIELGYAHGLENQPDQIAEGQATYPDVVSSVWASLNTELVTLESAAPPVTHPCPACAKALRRTKDENGFFWACSDCECKTTLLGAKDKPGERKAPPAPTGIAYPECGKELAHRVGTSKPIRRGMRPRLHDFYSCTGFLKCDAKCSTGIDGKPVSGDNAPATREAS